MAQYTAQSTASNSKIKQTQATIEKLQTDDDARYQQRDEILQKIETMRTTLAEHGTGSQLNMFISQDTRLELLRTIGEYAQQPDRSATYAGIDQCRPERIHRSSGLRN